MTVVVSGSDRPDRSIAHRTVRDSALRCCREALRRATLAAGFAGLAAPALAGAMHGDVPATVDTAAKYLFYMHGLALESAGPRAQAYDYRGILEALAHSGFEVIGEQRGPVRVDVYAEKVAGQVKRLREAGVPAANITVAGHSKGGMITLLVMSMLRDPEVAYVNFAGCGMPGSGFEGHQRFGQMRGPSARGILLSAYDRGDRIAGSCRETLDRMTNASVTERTLDIGGGHEAFYTPRAAWIDVLTSWADRRGP